MVSIGLSLRLEHTHPRTAVDLAVHAERHGFSGVMAADHFQPWIPERRPVPVRLERPERDRRAHHGRSGARV